LVSSYVQVQALDLQVLPGSIEILDKLTDGTVSMAFVENSLQDLYQASKDPKYYNFVEVPFLAQPFSMIYNIPELDNANVNLVFTWEVLVDICLGKIKLWNHPELVELNPYLVGVNGTIILVMGAGESDTTLLLTSRFSEVSPEWSQKYGPRTVWPSELDSVVSMIYTKTHIFSIVSEIFSNQLSFSLGSYSFLQSIGFAKGINFAGFLIDGVALFPNDTAGIEDSILQTSWNFSNQLEGLNINNTWPLTAMGYMILPLDYSLENCSDLRELLWFIRWSYTDREAQKVKNDAAYYQTSPDELEEILLYIDSITCNGQSLLEVKIVQLPRTAEISITVLFWIIFLASSIAMYRMTFTKVIAKIYAVISLLGLLLCGIALVFWSLNPTTDIVCTVRWWSKTLGMIIFSGSVFCRSYQLKKIHYLIKSGRYQATKHFDHIKLLCALMGMIILIQIIILFALQFTIPLSRQLRITDEVRRIGEYDCNSPDPKGHLIWIGVQSGYLVFILLMGVYSIYSTWGISSTVDDTRVNVITIFVCLVALGVGDVVVVDSPLTDESYCWWAITLIIIWSFSILCSLFLPRIIKIATKSSSGRTTTPSHAASSSTVTAAL